MKKTRIAYWIITVIFAAFMLMSGTFNALSTSQSLQGFSELHLPAYLSPFLGVAKIVGAIAILIPGFPRIKEWAYAGLFFDLLGATYCNIAAGHPVSQAGFMIVPVSLLFLSHALYHRLSKAYVGAPVAQAKAAMSAGVHS